MPKRIQMREVRADETQAIERLAKARNAPVHLKKQAQLLQAGATVQCYLKPPPHTRILCLDELGPLAAKTYPGVEWNPGLSRAIFEPDYGRSGVVWVHGAFEPATDQATILTSPRRDSARHIQLLEQIMREFTLTAGF